MDHHAIRCPRQGGDALHAPQRRGLLAEVGAHKQGCRDPPDPVERHGSVPPQATSGGAASVSRIVRRSVCTLSHSWSTTPWDSNRVRISVAFMPTMSSRIGTSTLTASSERTVRLAIWARYLFSDTAIVSPFRRLTCSIT